MTERVQSLGAFVAKIRDLRDSWNLPENKELWFRGESKQYATFLRPVLYRPRRDVSGRDQSLKSITELLQIENELYREFQRCSVQLRSERTPEEDWDWDAYFLMQHHGAATRLLDWSDGGLMALHFALRNKPQTDLQDAVVYILEPVELGKRLTNLKETKRAERDWKRYVKKHPADELSEDAPEEAYLPATEADFTELSLPEPPLLLDFPHITRRVAAQRSRFIIFGANPSWLAEESRKRDARIRSIVIDGACSYKIRCELRDSGVTESVIFPDLDGLGREMKQLWEDRK